MTRRDSVIIPSGVTANHTGAPGAAAASANSHEGFISRSGSPERAKAEDFGVDASGMHVTGITLPDYPLASEPKFKWGCHDGEEFAHILQCSYAEIVHWRRNLFMVPSGSVGKDFIRELTSLFTAYAQGSAMESIALTAAMVICVLLLQKPHQALNHAIT